jgi:predicted N-formylglutamate amidohydrolase
METHWAYDLGAAEIVRALSIELAAPAVLARFSRLLIDPNRDLDSPTLFRDVAEGRLIQLNRSLSAVERERRVNGLYRPFHQAFERLVRASPGVDLFSVHTFTPVYEGGAPRPMELGVLFERDEALAERFARAVSDRGWNVALNEPYTGKEGNMHSVDNQGLLHRRRVLELEVRQDVATEPRQRARLVHDLVAALGAAGLLSR